MAVFCEHDNEPSGSMKTEFLNQLYIIFSRQILYHEVICLKLDKLNSQLLYGFVTSNG
jgi:hypothetical protein